jgi:transcription initiation factor TFIID subunit 2
LLVCADVASDSSFVFREPVDPVALGIPQYYDVIPRKNARDLRTIRQKLEQDKYESFGAWEADIELMVRNAIHFNGADSEVGIIAAQLQARIEELVANLKGVGTGKKRKESDKTNGAPANKKAKLT